MTRIRLRQPVFAVMVVLLLILQLVQPSRTWMFLFTAFSGILISAYLWARSLGESLQLRRETRLGWIQVGGQIEERITLSNTSVLPAAWIQFEDHSTLPGFNASRSTSISAGFFDQWNVTAACKQRGLFYLGDANILTGDPFGIFDVTIHASERTSILVLPQVVTLPEISIVPSGSFGDGQPRRNAPEQTIHASTVREYVHGDSVRMIHWPTTARTNKVFVRLMESAPEGDWWILLDLDKNNLFGEGWDSIEEQSVVLTASLASKGLRNRKAVGLITNSKDAAWIHPQKGEGQRWEILQSLALSQPGELGLDKTLERIQSSLGRHHSLIIVTASTKTDWLKTLLPLVKRGIVPTVLLLDASTFGGKESPALVAANLEGRGIKYHIIPRGMLEAPKTLSHQQGGWKWRSTPTGEIMPIRS
ncbi:DUF58 domain-containing protein [Candidatus Villigracilis affinis]|uniref:DUF58 domain-containing protein n=1 Tax=Candidatus Villigracilis affinis TaxID=3140682 RepID=UPI001E058416|nr:DUF58 domain-containing protein [Anaerolineales bacterium]